MKTAEETLSAILDSADKEEQDIEKIKAYGRQCAEQALKDAAEKLMYANDPTPLDIEQSILSTPILTP